MLLSHYRLTEGRSMAAYRRLLAEAGAALGYEVGVISPTVWFGRLAPQGSRAAKWLGYLDQFVLFPPVLWWRQRRWPASTQVLVCDQALGPWVPLIRRFRHLVICHDLLALQASRGAFPQQPVGLSGRLYQGWIRWGFRHGQRFAAVSEASRRALAAELPSGHSPIELLPNPLPAGFSPLVEEQTRDLLERLLPGLAQRPYLLHVGGYWYKNREGVCAIFGALKREHPQLQLVLVGHLEQAAQEWLAAHPRLRRDVHRVAGVDQLTLQALYCGAAALVFPSWMEGFGWPVLEALACGCAVVTTDRPPMTEVGGAAVAYLEPCPVRSEARETWVLNAATEVAAVLNRPVEDQCRWRERGLRQAQRFSRELWLQRLGQLLQPG